MQGWTLLVQKTTMPACQELILRLKCRWGREWWSIQENLWTHSFWITMLQLKTSRKIFLDKETNPDIHRSDTFSFNLWTARNHILGCCPAFSANFLCYLTQAENMIFVEASLTKFLLLLCWGRGKPRLLHSWRVCVQTWNLSRPSRPAVV